MKKYITSQEDIRLLVDCFYEKVRKDSVIGYIFDKVANVDWERHLPIMYSFWEHVLFMTGSYSGNPMAAHMHLHRQSPLKTAHYEQWYHLFEEALEENFEGDVAEKARQRASSLATVMQIKVAASQGL